MGNRDIVAIGGSAGGVQALLRIVERLPAQFPASVLVTIHLPPHPESSLDQILSRVGPLPASFAEAGERLRKGRIYIAPPDRHLIVDDNRIHLGVGPRENNCRPAIDPMLRSAAVCCCSRVVGVVLTGTMGDGASGLWTVSQCGGMTVVQDPSSAEFPEMPRTAMELAKPDHIAELERIPALLHSLVHQPAGEPGEIPDRTRYEVAIARGGYGDMKELDRIGARSVLSCPECQGVMWEIKEGDLPRFRCHVGHTYSPDLMELALDDNLRRALGSAQRALEERLALARKLHQQAVDAGHKLLKQTWAARMHEFEQEMDVVRESVRKMEEIAARNQLERAHQALRDPKASPA